MDIEYSSRCNKALKNVIQGQCFCVYSYNDIFIKTDETSDNGKLCLCTSLDNGVVHRFCMDTYVTTIEAKVVVK